MGPDAAASVNLPAAVRFLGDALGVPSDLIRKELPFAATPILPEPETPLEEDQEQAEEEQEMIDA